MANTRELSQLASVISVADETRNIGIGTTNPISKLDVIGDIRVRALSVSGIATLGFFSDEQSVSQSASLGNNTTFYSVHKNITVESGTTLTVGSGSTIILNRFNNLDDPNAKSVTSPFIMSYNRISENFNVPTNYNATSIGPIVSIDDETIITVGSGAYWSIFS